MKFIAEPELSRMENNYLKIIWKPEIHTRQIKKMSSSILSGIHISIPCFYTLKTSSICIQNLKNHWKSCLCLTKRAILAYPEMGLIQLEGFRPFLILLVFHGQTTAELTLRLEPPRISSWSLCPCNGHVPLHKCSQFFQILKLFIIILKLFGSCLQ
jgi:hypothetical protein